MKFIKFFKKNFIILMMCPFFMRCQTLKENGKSVKKRDLDRASFEYAYDGVSKNHPGSKIGKKKSSSIDQEEEPLALTQEEKLSQQIREQALTMYKDKHFKEASNLYETSFLLDDDPLDKSQVWSKNILFYSYLAEGQFMDAKRIAQTMVQEYPYQSLSYQELGLSHLWLMELSSAKEAFKKSLLLQAHSAQSYFFLGVVLDALNEWRERESNFVASEKELLQILEKNNNDLQSKMQLVPLYLYWNKHLEDAEKFLLEITDEMNKKITDEEDETSPIEGDPIVHENKAFIKKIYIPLEWGIFYYLTKQPDKAISQLFIVLSNPITPLPMLIESYYYLGASYYALKEIAEAKSFLETVAIKNQSVFSSKANKILDEIMRLKKL